MPIVANEDDDGDVGDYNKDGDNADYGGDDYNDNDGDDDDGGYGGVSDSEVGDAHRCLCGRLPSLQPSSDVVASLNQNRLSAPHL